MSNGKHKQKIYLEDLPKYTDGEFKGCINWVGLDNVDVRFEYDGVLGTFRIIRFDRETDRMLVDYNGFQSWCYRSTIKRSQLTCILGLRNKEFKYQIGDIYKNENADFTIIDRKRIKNKKMYKYKCNKCGFDLSKPVYSKGIENDLWVAETNLTAGIGCVGCNRSYIQPGINSIVETDPWMIKYFLGGADEAKYYGSGSTVKVPTICPQCHQIKHTKIAIHLLKRESYSCPFCSDGISYPQKFVASVLRQCFEPFITEYYPKWAKGRKYDFYLPLENVIIEVDGGLGHGKKTYDNKPDLVGADIDREKDELAIENASMCVIRIPADKSELEYMRKSVEDHLSHLLDLDFFVDWKKVEMDAVKSIVVEVCKLYNDGLSTKSIAEKEHISMKTVYGYIKRGRKIGLVTEQCS